MQCRAQPAAVHGSIAWQQPWLCACEPVLWAMLWRSLSHPCCHAGCRPAHALHFAVYEYVREALGGNEEGHNSLIAGAAGAVATVMNDAIMTPTDVVKQRLQVCSGMRSGLFFCSKVMGGGMLSCLIRVGM